MSRLRFMSDLQGNSVALLKRDLFSLIHTVSLYSLLCFVLQFYPHQTPESRLITNVYCYIVFPINLYRILH